MRKDNLIFAIGLVAVWVLSICLIVSPAPIQVQAEGSVAVQVSPLSRIENYYDVQVQLQVWNKETPHITRLLHYGTSTKGEDLQALLIRVPGRTDAKTVLVTAAIHGNEPLSTTTVMTYLEHLLSSFGRDSRVTAMLQSRDVLFVPVVSPDSFPHSREVDGVDPNRDFPGPHDPDHRSVAPVAALQALFRTFQPVAVMSGHTYGRLYVTPYGDTREPCPDHTRYVHVFGRMARLADYQHVRACEVYDRPVAGTEVDWFYRNGAFSCVCEFGTHQHLPTPRDTRVEFERTWQAFLLFLEEGAK